MFKFDEYPEIKKAHEEYQDLMGRWYELEVEEDSYSKVEYSKMYSDYDRKIENLMYNIYAKAVFDAFSPIKPTLRAVWKKNKPLKWEKEISDTFDDCDEDQRRVLFGMVEEEDPYILPAEYYIGKTHVEEYLEKEAQKK